MTFLLLACVMGATEIEPTHHLSFGSYGSGPYNFQIPVGVVYYNSELYIVNSSLARIQVYTPEGIFVRQFGVYGPAPGQLDTPYYMIEYGGELFITETGNNRVSVLTPQGTLIRTFGEGHLTGPRGIHVTSDRIYVANRDADNIKVFDFGGALLETWGSTGTGNAQFRDPWGITGTMTKVYVSDNRNNRIQVFTPSGTFLTQIPVEYPIGLKVIDGTLYCLKREGVLRLTLDLMFLAEWGCNGNLYPWYFNSPFDLTGDLNRLYIVDTNNHRLQVWQYGTDPSGVPVQTTTWGKLKEMFHE